MKKSTEKEIVIDEVNLQEGPKDDVCDENCSDNMSEEELENTDTLTENETETVGISATPEVDWYDKFLRLQAEFDNYRKRTLKEKMDLVENGGRNVLRTMIEVRDDVQRTVIAMGKSDDVNILREGVTLVANKFTETLKQNNVVEIDIKGKDFDSDFSEAVARFAAGEDNKGKVIDVIETGYMLNDKVLRFAKVVVGE